MTERLYEAIERRMTECGVVRVAIDGMSGAGKSSLARALAERWSVDLFHMDDFFLPFAAKTPERLAVPGGNVDHERFLHEVMLPLSDGKPFSYRPFDCGRQTLGEAVVVEPGALQIVEGVYSMHPSLRAYYDLTVFLTLSPEEQSRRILHRNGEAMHRRFLEEWIPLENAYFDAFSIRERADIVLDTTDWIK